jgi:hypothetical protein
LLFARSTNSLKIFLPLSYLDSPSRRFFPMRLGFIEVGDHLTVEVHQEHARVFPDELPVFLAARKGFPTNLLQPRDSGTSPSRRPPRRRSAETASHASARWHP